MNISFLTFTTMITLSITNLVQAKELLTEKDIVKTAQAPNIAISQDDQTNIHANIEQYDVKAYYDKSEVMIPMRDGVNLFTAIYSPKDQSKDHPILFYRTPYSIQPYGKEYRSTKKLTPSLEMLQDGYIFVLQDIRGTYKSEGHFEVIRTIRQDKSNPMAIDESTDNYDSIEWLLNNLQGHNGRVGQWGVSYAGWTTLQGMIDAHPALKASSPQASPSDMFIGDDWHHNGAFRLTYAFAWMNHTAQQRDTPTVKKPEPFDYGTSWGYEFFLNAGPTSELNKKYFKGRVPAWKDFINHPNYDEFWQRQNALQYLDNIKHPILNVAGWFDAEDFYGPVSIYQEIEKRNPNNQSTFVSGPWRHGGWAFRGDGSSLGDIQFGAKTSEYYQKHIVSPFFRYHLKGEGNWNAKEAIVFETGGNRWHRFDQWPPKNNRTKNLYFHVDGKLSFDKPNTKKTAADDYISDPNKPVPFTSDFTAGWPGHTWMIEDQRATSTRTDVLVYQTEVLEEDIRIAGPILVNLFASTSGTDSDFFVKLIDVFPGDTRDAEPNPTDVRMGSYQMLVGVETMRAKYRNDYSNPEPMTPNEVTPISFNIWDKFHTFKKGHRIMVQVHSSWFPAYDRNPQQFMDIYRAKKKDYKEATQKIYRSGKTPSHIVLPISAAPTLR